VDVNGERGVPLIATWARLFSWADVLSEALMMSHTRGVRTPDGTGVFQIKAKTNTIPTRIRESLPTSK
jgi:hypothetical protein